MNAMKTLILGMMIAVLTATTVGCNTIRGAGRDIEEGGEAIQDAATDAQN